MRFQNKQSILNWKQNDTLNSPSSTSSTAILLGFAINSTNVTGASASGHIIAVISKNVTATQAETILTMLTHNATGGRIGNNVTISTTAQYSITMRANMSTHTGASITDTSSLIGASF
jgi:hypothetical protein